MEIIAISLMGLILLKVNESGVKIAEDTTLKQKKSHH